MIAFCLEHSKWDQNPKFTPLSEMTSIPTPFICGVPPPPGHVMSVCTPSLHVVARCWHVVVVDVVQSLKPVRFLATRKQMQQLTMLHLFAQCFKLIWPQDWNEQRFRLEMTSGISFFKKLWKSKLRTNNFIKHRKTNYIIIILLN